VAVRLVWRLADFANSLDAFLQNHDFMRGGIWQRYEGTIQRPYRSGILLGAAILISHFPDWKLCRK
jgi:hypothetical protein